MDCRAQAADSMQFEAQQRIEDPVYGCVRIVSQLYDEIRNAETQLAKTRAEISTIGSKPNTMINVQDHNYYHNHDDNHALQVLESELINQLNLEGQNTNIDEPSQFGPSTQPPRMV